MIHLQHSVRQPSRNSRHIGASDPTQVAEVTIHLRRRPGHDPIPSFKEFLGCPVRPKYSEAEFALRWGCHPNELYAVAREFKNHGLEVTSTHAGRREVKLQGTIAQFNAAFVTEVLDYEKDHYGNRVKFRAHAGVHVADTIAPFIIGVNGLATEPHTPPKRSTFSPNRSVASLSGVPTNVRTMTGPDVANLYNFPRVKPVGQTAGIFLQVEWGYSLTDVDTTLSQWGVQRGNVTQIVTDGGTPANPPTNGEGNLDLAMIAAFGMGVDTIVFFNEHTDNWATSLNRIFHPNPGEVTVNVLSMSDVFPTGDDFDSSFFTPIENALQDAAILGITVLSATGDTGSAGYGTDGKPHLVYIDSPWVTTVGGTVLGNVDQKPFLEWVWNDDPANVQSATGGGISNFFPIPDYQSDLTMPTSIATGHRGRGTPDIAGNASPYSPYTIYVNGKPIDTGGVSATTPMYGGLICVLNSILGRNLGFLNPTLYQFAKTHPNVFRDIDGSTGGSQNNGTFEAAGYPVAVGWDACTGLGVIDGQNFLNALADSNHHVFENNVQSSFSGSVDYLLYWNHQVYLHDLADQWHVWNGTAWADATDPRA